jgi:NADPH:quinone reductase-like Zn-dependent oxidoreductase
MQALVFDRAGEPADVLRIANIPDPVGDSDRALVQIAARPIHPADLAFIRVPISAEADFSAGRGA